ncbi:hypothetical protein [Microbacterium atlanticum]|uniref:FMN-binding protein n=1 Tax=Microbacterium atlanticum TaxID=2782168 RepID=UPI001E5D6BC0|nr:hypothetical protein [Microbacterium atlanticum]
MSSAIRAGAAVGVALLGATLTSCAASDPDSGRRAERSESSYRDGEYTATGWYGSLPSHHDVTLTIRNDTVQSVRITTPAEDPTSLEHQQRFAQALPDAIVGRDVDALDIDRLAGASGCSEGFMNALEQIKSAAFRSPADS